MYEVAKVLCLQESIKQWLSILHHLHYQEIANRNQNSDSRKLTQFSLPSRNPHQG
jgi:hypothetical protein